MKLPIIAAAFAIGLGLSGAFAREEGAGRGAADRPHAHPRKERGAEFGAPGDPTKVTRTIAIGMGDDMRFTPASVEVRMGETVRFLVKNNGRLKHEMVLGTRAELEAHAAQMRRSPHMSHHDPNAVSVEPGGTGTLIWRFTKTGRFDFACLVPGHFEAGMAGKVVVGH